jgi:hypothetical protein
MRESFWKEYNQKPIRQIWLVKYHNKERGLGNEFLNEWFPGCETHHINKEEVVFIPRQMHEENLHCLETGEGMEVINQLALNFIGRQ